MRFLLVPAPSEFTICRNRQSSRNREQHAISVQFTSPGLAELLSVFCVDAMLCEEFTGSAATEHARLRPRIARPDASTDKHRNDLGEEDLCAARDANQALRSTVRNGTASISAVARAPICADPQDQPHTKRIAHKGIWVEPELSAEIEYRAKSAEGKMRHPFFIKVYARISPLGTGADFRRWFFVRHARRLTHWNGGPSVLSPRLGPFFRCHQVCRRGSPPSLLSRTTGRFMKKPQREFDRDEIVVCMVLTVCIGNAVISTIYRMLG